MKITSSGRAVYPSGSKAAREYAENNLLSIYARWNRLLAIFGRLRLRGETKEVRIDNPLSLLPFPASSRNLPAALGSRLDGVEEWLLLRDYEKAERSRTILFLFREGSLDSVLKVRETESGGRALTHEARVLEKLHADSVEKVPEVLELTETNNQEMLLLSPLEGTPLSISMQRSLRPFQSHTRHLRRAGKWLGRFHRQVRSGGDSDTVIVHGDLWARNILFDGSTLSGVVDWERASFEGNRWHDLFTLPLLFAMNRPSWKESDRLKLFRRAFIEKSREGEAIRDYVGAYLEEAGVEASRIEPMFLQYLEEEERRGKEESGWRTFMPWQKMREQVRSAPRNVFSG